jgi:hypothetical protein
MLAMLVPMPTPRTKTDRPECVHLAADGEDGHVDPDSAGQTHRQTCDNKLPTEFRYERTSEQGRDDDADHQGRKAK